MADGADSKVLKKEPLDPKDAKWTALELITYTDPTSQIRTWESAYRPTRPTNSDIDAIGIAAILQPSPTLSSSTKVSPLVAQVQASGKPCLLLQRQFRPPVEKVCVEVPAGLVDEGETAEQCAIRELKEETGFVGEIMGGGFGVTPVMFNDPGFCTTNLVMIHMTIDLSNPANHNPVPSLEDGEFIECFAVPLDRLYDQVKKLEQEGGYAIDARVGNLAEGIEIARRWCAGFA